MATNLRTPLPSTLLKPLVAGVVGAVLLLTGSVAPAQVTPDQDSGSYEQRLMERLTPDQLEAFLAGAHPASIVLEDGTTLEEFLLEGLIDTASNSVYHPLNQCLVVRTATGLGGAKYTANENRPHTVRGICGVPLEATAVVMNAKFYSASSSGQVSVYPFGHSATPAVVNVQPGQTVNNMVTVAMGSAGDFSVKPSVAVHAVIHTVGYFAPLPVGGPIDADTLDSLDSTAFATRAELMGTTDIVSWDALKDVPPGLDDGDDDTLAGLGCTTDQIASWNGNAWVCIDNNVADLSAGLCRLADETGICLTACGSCSSIVFVTSTTSGGNLGGLNGADARCNARATAGGLPGVYTAWLSSSTTNARQRISQSGPQYVNTRNGIIANSLADLTDGNLIQAIKYDEFRNDQSPGIVFAGTDSSGNKKEPAPPNDVQPPYCSNWTTNGSGIPSTQFAIVGRVNQTDARWTDTGPNWCSSTTTHIYCVQVHTN